MSVATRVLTSSAAHLALAAQALGRGELVAMPTETVYGLAADAHNASAISAVFTAKARPSDDPLIVHVAPSLLKAEDPVASLQALGLLAPELPEGLADDLRRLSTCWPGPLTMVVPRGPRVPDLVSSGLPTVALRMPAHPVACALLTAFGGPLVAPSANRFGRISPTTAQAVVAELDGRIGWVIDGGPCDVGVESTVLLLLGGGRSRLLRPGGIGTEQIHQLLGTAPEAPVPQSTLLGPGMSPSHYAPRAPALLAPRLDDWTDVDWHALSRRLPSDAQLAWLAWSGDPDDVVAESSFQLGVSCEARVLSEQGDPEEAARHLFQLLRELDQTQPTLLVIERCPAIGALGDAIRDRVQRAVHNTPPLHCAPPSR